MDTKRSFPVVLLLLLAGCVGTAPSGGSPPATVLILHTNDLHSHLLPDSEGSGGLARIGGYVEEVRAGRADVLFLDAGDAVTGTPVSSLHRGRPVFHVMTAMGYDAMALGNHEFDHGWRRIEEYRRIAEFPILAANVEGPGGDLLADAAYRVFDVDGVRVGVIGLTTEHTPALTAPGATEGTAFVPVAEALRSLLPEVERRSDLVVALTHLGHRGDRELAAAVPGVDVIVGGHSHTALEAPDRVGKTLIVQAGSHGSFVGRLELRVDVAAGEVLEARGSLVPVDARLPEHPDVRRAVAIWEDAVSERVDVEIGRADRDYSPEDLMPVIERIFLEALGTDLGFQNPGGIRTALPRGPITIRRIWTILPFENTLVTVRVRGAKLPAAARTRLAAVEPERVYTVATNSHVAGHLSRYFPEGIEGRVESGRSMRDTVIGYVIEHGAIE